MVIYRLSAGTSVRGRWRELKVKMEREVGWWMQQLGQYQREHRRRRHRGCDNRGITGGGARCSNGRYWKVRREDLLVKKYHCRVYTQL